CSLYVIFFFFFSSRRRHTRWPRDWSSDVCSSDLSIGAQLPSLFLKHRHSDGSWAPMERVKHDAAAHDAERSWPRRAIFRCTVCRSEERRVGKECRSRWEQEQ